MRSFWLASNTDFALNGRQIYRTFSAGPILADPEASHLAMFFLRLRRRGLDRKNILPLLQSWVHFYTLRAHLTR